MIILGKKLVMSRGNSVTLQGELFINVDETTKAPYTIPTNLQNPYLLIAIGNTESFEADKGAIYKYWLPADFILPTISRIPTYSETRASGTMENTLYYELIGNERNYFYYDGETKTQKDYSCRFKKTFLPIDTRKWKEQNWNYGVFLMTGVRTVDHLQSLYRSLGLLGKDDDESRGINSSKWLYDKIKSYDRTKVINIDPYSPLVNAQTFDKIEKLEKLIIE